MSSTADDIFERAKERSLTDFLETVLGVTAHGGGSHVRMDSCPSPSCGASMAGSQKLIIRHDRTWRCYSCGNFGTIIDAAMHIYGYLDAPLKAAQEIVHGRIEPVMSPAQVQYQRDADLRRRQWGAWVVKRIYEASRETFDRTAWDYLVGTRGLDPKVVHEAWRRGILAGLPANREAAAHWLRSVVGERELRYAGLWKDDSPTPWIAGRPVVQFVDNREMAEFRIAYKPKNPTTKKSLAVGLPGTPYFWEGGDASRCLVVEGCLEMLAALSMGYPGCVLSASGTSSWNISWFRALRERGIATFDLAFNNDHRVDPDGEIHNPGQDAQAALAKALAGEGMAYTDASPVEVGDINDALLRRRQRQ